MRSTVFFTRASPRDVEVTTPEPDGAASRRTTAARLRRAVATGSCAPSICERASALDVPDGSPDAAGASIFSIAGKNYVAITRGGTPTSRAAGTRPRLGLRLGGRRRSRLRRRCITRASVDLASKGNDTSYTTPLSATGVGKRFEREDSMYRLGRQTRRTLRGSQAVCSERCSCGRRARVDGRLPGAAATGRTGSLQDRCRPSRFRCGGSCA